MSTEILILVTRVGFRGHRLAEKIRRSGWSVSRFEPYRLEAPKDPAGIARTLASLLPVDLLVMTSQEGVRQARNLPGCDQLIRLPLVVPGQATAAVARDQGFTRVMAPGHGGNSEAMLALQALSEVAGKRILILAASEGRRLLDQELQQRGAIVRRLNVYRRVPLPLESDTVARIRSARRLITLIASDGALNALHDQLEPDLWLKLADSKVLVPSVRVGDNARRLGCEQVMVTAGADNQAMLDALPDATSDT